MAVEKLTEWFVDPNYEAELMRGGWFEQDLIVGGEDVTFTVRDEVSSGTSIWSITDSTGNVIASGSQPVSSFTTKTFSVSYPQTGSPFVAEAKVAGCRICDADLVQSGQLFCPLCKSALLEVRKKFLAETFKWLNDDKEENVRLHQGMTRSGGLIHAVRLVRRGEYHPRAECGVKIAEAKARKFETAEGETCSRCRKGLGTA